MTVIPDALIEGGREQVASKAQANCFFSSGLGRAATRCLGGSDLYCLS